MLTVQSGLEEPYCIPHILDYTKGQVEKAPTTGKLHWQLIAYSRNTISWSAVQKKYPGHHLESVRYVQDANDYVWKDDTRVAGPFEWGDPPQQGQRNDIRGAIDTWVKLGKRAAVHEHAVTIAKYQRGIEYCVNALREPYVPPAPHLYPHMESFIKRFLEDPYTRRIYVLYDTSGKSGKSDVSRYLRIKHGAHLFDGDVSYNDAAYILGGLDPFPEIICFDIPRGPSFPFPIGRLCEKLKDGFLTSCKYESKVINFQLPKILITANERVPSGTWSDDRPIQICWEEFSQNKHGQVREEGPGPQEAHFQAVSKAL